MRGDTRVFNVWVMVRPAAGVAGQWVAHCLDFDVVSQGNSLEHALAMVHEAAVMVALDDLNAGRDPLERRAPESFFGELYGLFERGEQRRYDEVISAAEAGRLVCFATQFELPFERDTGDDEVVARSMRPTQISFAQQVC